MRKPVNFMLVLVIALPLLAVVASLASLALAVTRGDRELPQNYHWEGSALDRDQARLLRGSQQRLAATLSADPQAQRCTVRLQGAAPAALRLTLTHPGDAQADRQLTLQRHGALYTADCSALPAAHWWVELGDDQGQWLLRTRANGALAQPLAIGAAPAPAGSAP